MWPLYKNYKFNKTSQQPLRTTKMNSYITGLLSQAVMDVSRPTLFKARTIKVIFHRCCQIN